MVIRVVNYSTYEEWYEEKFGEGEGKSLTQLTDKDFMELYNREETFWAFDNLKDFCDEFNTDGPYAPTPSSHIIRFFPNE
jgi:hypothetical protein